MHARPATPDDADEIAAVIAEVAAEGWLATEPPVDVGQRAAAFRETLSEGHALWVLEQDGRVVGTAGLHPTHAPGVVSLGMAIVSSARGHGGGNLLMEQMLVWLEAGDAHKVELEVWPDNAPAIALYRRHGFAVEGMRRDHYRRRDGSLRSALIMARLVAAAAGADPGRQPS